MGLERMMNHLNKVGKRYDSFLMMAEHVIDNHSPTILETGCMRQEDNYEGDGMSTLFFDNLLTMTNAGHFYSIDNNQENVYTATKILAKYHPTSPGTWTKTRIICSDSVPFLKKENEHLFGQKGIDLLYLDSLDMEYPNPEPAFLNTIFEFMSVSQYLNHGALICVDDNIESEIDTHDGKIERLKVSKGHFLRKYLETVNNFPIYEGYQVIWKWNKYC